MPHIQVLQLFNIAFILFSSKKNHDGTQQFRIIENRPRIGATNSGRFGGCMGDPMWWPVSRQRAVGAALPSPKRARRPYAQHRPRITNIRNCVRTSLCFAGAYGSLKIFRVIAKCITYFSMNTLMFLSYILGVSSFNCSKLLSNSPGTPPAPPARK